MNKYEWIKAFFLGAIFAVLVMLSLSSHNVIASTEEVGRYQVYSVSTGSVRPQAFVIDTKTGEVARIFINTYDKMECQDRYLAFE